MRHWWVWIFMIFVFDVICFDNSLCYNFSNRRCSMIFLPSLGKQGKAMGAEGGWVECHKTSPASSGLVRCTWENRQIGVALPTESFFPWQHLLKSGVPRIVPHQLTWAQRGGSARVDPAATLSLWYSGSGLHLFLTLDSVYSSFFFIITNADSFNLFSSFSF